MNINEKIAQELNIKTSQVENTIKLIDDGNTIPFIARYRKEVTGNLSDETLREFDERLKYLRNLESRKEEIIRLIDEQGKLTDELKQAIEKAEILSELEDIYRPYKQKKRTRATIAKEKGLEPLSNIIYLQSDKRDINEIAKEFIDPEKGVETIEDALNGAKDIIAETVADNAEYRKKMKKLCNKEAVVTIKAANEDEKSPYEMYYNFNETLRTLPSHRILAINRGEKENYLKVKVEKPDDKVIGFIENDIIKDKNSQFGKLIEESIEDGYKRLIEPSVDREIRSELFEKAEEKAIKVFGKNAKQLLLQAPIKNITVLGFDPAYRTGCKLAVIDKNGKLLDTATVYPTEPQNDVAGATKVINNFIEKYDINMIAIGNGTASRESEMFVSDLISKSKKEIYYAIVSEAGASVYSASKLATEEYPDINVSLRGAISIARRLQDPLAELVKIEPKAIGVGQYQHDVNQKKLGESLDFVVEKSVNLVGVNVNTASPAILKYISGLTKTNIDKIIKYREQNGKITSRQELIKNKVLTPKTYEQSIGFMRVIDGTNLLDKTSIHPESYEAALRLIEYSNLDIKDIGTKEFNDRIDSLNLEKYGKENNIDKFTLEDIVKCLKQPNRDFRDDFEKPLLKSNILTIKDLRVGMELQGTVRNVVDFGAFIDIGLHDDGLAHISKLSKDYIKHPLDVVSVGDIVTCYVDKIDLEREKVNLSLIKPDNIA